MFNVQFQYPEALWLLVAVPVFILLFTAYQLWKKRAAKKIGDPRLVGALTKTYSRTKSVIKFTLLTLAFALGCIALANPRQPEGGDGAVRKGVDVTFVLDISNSMLATDIAPSRLENAKALMTRLLRQMPDNRMALVLFAGQGYIQSPLTSDYSAVQLFINSAGPSTVAAQGTAIADALEKAELAFASSEDRYKAIVLITDGETHDEAAVDKAKELSTKGIIINTVGIGSPEGTTIIDTATGNPRTDATGTPVISKLNEPLLKEIAASANGGYIHLQNVTDATKAIIAQFASAEKKAIMDTSLLNYNTLYAWLAIPMLLFLLVEIFIPDRKKVAA